MATLADRAARLAKADLVTGMVAEFPELQGLMGGYYAAAQGEDPRVATAIRDHYKPVGQGDEVPTDPVTVAVSLADKLDTLVGFFTAALPPTGSKDPFALRRAALAWLSTTIEVGVRVQLLPMIKRHAELVIGDIQRAVNEKTRAEAGPGAIVLAPRISSPRGRDGFNGEFERSVWALLDFFADRLKIQQREAGVRHDLIDAVFALGGEDDLVRLLARVRALQAFMASEDGANLLTGYRRAANILKKEGFDSSASPRHPGLDPGSRFPVDAAAGSGTPGQARGDEKTLSYTPEPAEEVLIAALGSAEPRAARAVQAEDFAGAMAALASLRAPIDAFFDTKNGGVTVNDPDAAKRAARLALLARMRDAVHAVADFSRIEG